MKIIVTGANGFVGKSLKKPLEDCGHKVLAFNRQELDLLDANSVAEKIKKETPDIIIHCAVKGGTRFDPDSFEYYQQNLSMYENLKQYSSNFGYLLNIGSGAEFDRSKSINRAKEYTLFESNPQDFYGKAKNQIAKDVVNTENFYNLRIFGCFGPYEKSNRLFKIAYEKNKKSEDIIISDDKEMDYIHVDYLINTIIFYISNLNDRKLPKDINVVHGEKLLLSNLANEFIPESDKKSNIIVGTRVDLDYTGDASIIEDLRIDEISKLTLKKSLLKYYNQLKIEGVHLE